MATRLSRSEQTEENRARVLAAAREVFLRRGFHAVSVDEIAEAAGFSRGVVYSQFGGKADLVLALLEVRIAERAEQNRALAADLAGVEGVRAIAAAGATDHEDNAEWVLLLLEFRVHAARDPELSARYAALHRRTVAELADTLAGLYARAGVDPPRPVRTLAHAMLAIASGIPLEWQVDRSALGDDTTPVEVFAPVFDPAPPTGSRHP
ncbi:MAG: TetR/AcrR family transcriptional regulator [Acidimicrobiia bacterium]